MRVTSAIVVTFLTGFVTSRERANSVKDSGNGFQGEHQKTRTGGSEQTDISTCLDITTDLHSFYREKMDELQHPAETRSAKRMKELEREQYWKDRHGMQDENLSNSRSTCSIDMTSIAPCTCNDTTLLILSCSEVESFEMLKQTLNGATLQVTEFDIFIYSPINFLGGEGDTLLDNTFGGLSFKEIYIEGTSVRTVEDLAFAGSENVLSILSMQGNNFLSVFPFEQLVNYVELTELFLERGLLRTIPMLGLLPNLARFTVNTNLVDTIAILAFENLPSLRQLTLYNNQLVNIPHDALHFTAHNTFVGLDNNEIVSISPFSGSQPIQLILPSNNLTTFHQSVYGPILDRILECSYQTIVDVTRNPIECHEMEWVYSNPSYTNHVFSDCDQKLAPFD